MFNWEEETDEVLVQLRRSKQRMERLRELALSGKITKQTHDSLVVQFQKELVESDKRRKELLSKLMASQKELTEQARILEKLNSDLEMKLAYSSISEDHYVKTSTALKYGLEETLRELEAISNAIKQLSEEAPKIPTHALDRAIRRLDENERT